MSTLCDGVRLRCWVHGSHSATSPEIHSRSLSQRLAFIIGAIKGPLVQTGKLEAHHERPKERSGLGISGERWAQQKGQRHLSGKKWEESLSRPRSREEFPETALMLK